MIVFYLGNSIKEAEETNDFLPLDEKIHSELEKRRDFPKGINFIAELDPYDDRVLQRFEIEKMTSAIQEFIPGCENEEHRSQFKKLLELCKKALDNDKLIFALGD